MNERSKRNSDIKESAILLIRQMDKSQLKRFDRELEYGRDYYIELEFFANEIWRDVAQQLSINNNKEAEFLLNKANKFYLNAMIRNKHYKQISLPYLEIIKHIYRAQLEYYLEDLDEGEAIPKNLPGAKSSSDLFSDSSYEYRRQVMRNEILVDLPNSVRQIFSINILDQEQYRKTHQIVVKTGIDGIFVQNPVSPITIKRFIMK